MDGNGKLPEIVRLEAEVEKLCAQLGLAEKALAELRQDLRSMERICETQPYGLLTLLLSTVRGALERSFKLYPEE